MANEQPSVFRSLSASRHARATGALDLGSGRSAVLWRNHDDRVTYADPEGHTFSLYLEGGRGTRRADGPSVAGWPGAFSVMPNGRRSEWEITAPFGFVHLYLPVAELGRIFAETFDRDARMLEVAEVTFVEAPRPAAALARIARAIAADDPLDAEEAVAELVASWFGDPVRGESGRGRLVGGLAPHVVRRILDHVEDRLHGPIRLADLASLAGLSAFHVQRSFKAMRGISPQAHVAHRRIARAKLLLRGPDTIAVVASACGFSSQSHLTRAFRAATGLTPAAYRRQAA